MGPNAVMYWNQGNLRPTSMRAGATYVIPLEELTVHVHQRHYRLALFIGDWFVKEFRVGVGRRDTPTPVGEFKVDSKEENPDWWFNGKLIRFGDPKNELGSRWIAIYGDDLPLSAGIGIHGTNKPDTVGSRCSNGCVRLKNDEVNELFWWVRTGYNGGPATRIFVR
jgi:lipoprotein-anchoring transpeptidase ErfK/SrfK